MTSEEIYRLEFENRDKIHLLLAGKFYQAWEMSAYQFTRHFFEYRVHPKYIQKVSSEMVYLGFSSEALEKVKKVVEEKNFALEKKDERHLVISGFTPFLGFAKWKAERFAEKGEAPSSASPSSDHGGSCPHPKDFLFACKEFYELVKYLFARTLDVSKGYKYGLCDKLREDCLNTLDHLQCALSQGKNFDGEFVWREMVKIRIKVRLLSDFKEISVNQLLYVCDKISTVSKALRLGSLGPRVQGESRLESGGPLAGEILSSKKTVGKIL